MESLATDFAVGMASYDCAAFAFGRFWRDFGGILAASSYSD